VAAEILLHPEQHLNCAYTLTGEEALSYQDAAALFTQILARPIEYIDTSHSTEKIDLPKHQSPFYPKLMKGDFAVISTAVREILGRNAVTLAQYIQDYKALFE
jgi:uncharacterized protein YbjT (DUF2867 family)